MVAAVTAIDTLATQFRAAALQRRHLEPWLDDKRFADPADGKQILYAVDSDVVALFADPHTVSISVTDRKGNIREGYAEVIPGQERHISEALGWFLANFIFMKLSTDWPVFILSPVDQEITDIFNGIARDAEHENSRALVSMKRLELWANQHRSVAIDQNYFRDQLKEILLVLVGDRSNSAKLLRLSRLLNSQRLYNLDQYLSVARLPDESARKALTPPAGIVEMVEFNQLVQRWSKRVSERAPPQRFADLNENDARMLARLEWINTKLDQGRFRFVLITGSRLVSDVAAAYTNARFDNIHSFERKFIRSPKAFLGDTSVLSPVLDTPGDNRVDFNVGRRLQDWLNAVLNSDERRFSTASEYLALLDQWINSNADELKRVAADKLKVYPKLAIEIQEKWKAFTKELSVWIAQSETQRRLAFLDNPSLPTRDQIILLRNELETNVRRSWDEVYEAALGSALTAKPPEHGTAQRYPRRNLPHLYLDGHPATNAAIARYLQAWRRGKLTPELYLQLRNAPETDPPNRIYLSFLAQAYVLGLTGRWHLSAVTAALAVSVARDYRERDPQMAIAHRISGREAAFWRAYSMRSSARNISDLRRAHAAIALAREYAQRDKLEAEHPLDPQEIRFDAEELAIDVTIICHRLFMNDDGFSLSEDILESILTQITLASNLIDFITSDRSIEDLVKTETEFSNAFQRTITIYFMLALFGYGRRAIDVAEINRRLDQFRLLLEHETVGDRSDLSYLTMFIYYAAGSVFAPDRDDRRKARSEFRTLHRMVANNYAMPYDEKRFAYLAEMVRGESH